MEGVGGFHTYITEEPSSPFAASVLTTAFQTSLSPGRGLILHGWGFPNVPTTPKSKPVVKNEDLVWFPRSTLKAYTQPFLEPYTQNHAFP